MCGLTGIWNPPSGGLIDPEAAVRKMTSALVHRGPDAEGLWKDETAQIALGHRRLSILDLSPNGAQPMTSRSGRYIIAFNGEIYNHLHLREEIGDIRPEFAWAGHSDTETILAALDVWGFEHVLERIEGMFAIAVWDREARNLLLARDRMGEKPLYFGSVNGAFVFASELKAIAAVPGFGGMLDRAAMIAFLRYGYVPDPLSVYEGIQKLSPGCMMRLAGPRQAPDIRRYWSMEDIARTRPPELRSADATDFKTLSTGMEKLLREVVEAQMISDVPLGSFLSGGIDSSLVTALMQSVADRPVKTFSVAFDAGDFNEADHAAGVARHLGTDHTEFRLSEKVALAAVPDLAAIYDEPFSDSSQIPTLLLCREARKSVTVALTGDGGDEVFGGYNRHIFGPAAWKRASRAPRLARRQLGLVANLLHRFGGARNPVLRSAMQRAGLPAATLEKIGRLGEALGSADDICGLYRGLVSTFEAPESLLEAPGRERADDERCRILAETLGPAELMMVLDSVSYLPGDILVKVDRASMNASLETRAPLLDVRVVEAAWHLPPEARVRGRSGKRILRDILDRHVPSNLVERPKQGFAVPLDRWLRSGLRNWAGDLFGTDRLFARSGLKKKAVARLWQDHLSGRTNNGQKLWTVLMLLAWFECDGNAHASAASRDSAPRISA